MITAVEDHYWTFQYWTTVAGRGGSWWPDDGTGYFDTEDEAAEAARSHSETHKGQLVRLVEVRRSRRFGESLVRLRLTDDLVGEPNHA